MVEPDFYIVMGILTLFAFLWILLRAFKEPVPSGARAH